MKVTLSFHTDNASFRDNPTMELNKIRRTLEEEMKRFKYPPEHDSLEGHTLTYSKVAIVDLYGDTIGEIEIEASEENDDEWMKYGTVGDLNDKFDVFAEPSSIRRWLQARYDTELPAFFVRGDLTNAIHAEVYAATSTGDDAPLKRLQ